MPSLNRRYQGESFNLFKFKIYKNVYTAKQTPCDDESQDKSQDEA